MQACDHADVRQGPTLADMPPEILSGILAWLPAPAIGACLASSRAFNVLSRFAAARYRAERIAQGAAGICPCSGAYSGTAGVAQAQPYADTDLVSHRVVGHARECLPNALLAAAGAGRLDVVCAIYRHAILLWYGDSKVACCIDPLGPDPTRALIDTVRSLVRDKMRCRLRSCAVCAAFLAWLFRCHEPIGRFVSAFPVALAAGHTATAVWIGSVSSPFRLLQALEAALAILGDGGRTNGVTAKRTNLPEQNATTIVADGGDRGTPIAAVDADKEGQPEACSQQDPVDDVVLACLWHACPGTEARFVKDAAIAGDLDALRRMLRVRRHAALAFGEENNRASAFPGGLDYALDVAAVWRTPKTTLTWLWETLDMASDRTMCQLVAKAAPGCGLLELGIDALCAFRRHTAALVCERLVETPHRTVHGSALAGYGDYDGLIGTENGDLFDFLDNVDDDPATARVPCFIVAQTLRSGCAEAIDGALGRWKQCGTCATFGQFACSHFSDRGIAALDAGLIHVVEAHPHISLSHEALGAVMRSPRADSLIGHIESRPLNDPLFGAAKWIEQAARNGCARPVLFLLWSLRTDYDACKAVDTGPALVAAATAGHLDVAALLMPQATQKPSRKSDLDVMLAIEGAVRACPRAAVAWAIQHVDPRLHASIWTAAAMCGNVDLVADMARESSPPGALFKRPRSFIPFVSMAVAHGHVGCASALLELDIGRHRHQDVDTGLRKANRPRQAKRQYTRSHSTTATSLTTVQERPRPTLAPSYVADALIRGYTHAIDWAASGPFRIPWSQVPISSALDRIAEPKRLAAVLTWLLESRAATETPSVVADLRAWARSALLSRDPIRIGSVVGYCPWRDWDMSEASLATAICHCPVAMWRTIDVRHPGLLNRPCFADAIIVSGRVDLAVWMQDERRSSDGVAFDLGRIATAGTAGSIAMGSWLAARLVG
ncbi:hypothetical protein pkur_cds_757 [Pandoravirus kuranda]|uniref:F-box domain containing protein n=1 Tax=Pandoravirus kuranda TaxID=3019033 RepID=A0AA95EDC9_9VIRU|nr:hypothetical protein pkur_cds_757 [Pandoravirus kuranda]